MKTQNMKLLDLQTGEYLELGKDWGFFGEFILLNLGSAVELNIKEWGSVSYGDNAYGWHGYIGQETKQPHTNPIINKIAETVGAVVYGGRYVLLRVVFDDYTIGDLYTHGKDDEYTGIFCMLTKLGECIQTDDSRCDGVYKHIIGNAFNVHIPSVDPIYIDGVALNIFKEYSKQLRNEENKFEELMEKLK